VTLPLKPAAAVPVESPPPAGPCAKPAPPAVPLAARPCSHKHNSSNAKELKKLMGHDCGKKEPLQQPPAPRKSKSLSAVPNKVIKELLVATAEMCHRIVMDN
jgi:hypothetical protein